MQAMTDAPDLSPTAASHAQDTRPRSLARWTMRIVGGLLALVLIAYLVALGAQVRSVHQAQQRMSQLATLRPGMSVAEYQRIVGGCTPYRAKDNDDDHEYCTAEPMLSGLIRARNFLPWMDSVNRNAQPVLSRIGLRPWGLMANVEIHQGRLIRINSTLVFPHASRRAEIYLTRSLAEYASQDQHARSPQSHYYLNNVLWADNEREGDIRPLTPQSTPAELAARQVRTRCLYFSQGCTKMHELLPNLPYADGAGDW